MLLWLPTEGGFLDDNPASSSKQMRTKWRFKGAERRRKKWRIKSDECPGDRGENGDLRARSAGEKIGELRAMSARAIEESMAIHVFEAISSEIPPPVSFQIHSCPPAHAA